MKDQILELGRVFLGTASQTLWVLGGLLWLTRAATRVQSIPSLRSEHDTSHKFQTQISNALKPVIPNSRFKGNVLPQDVLASSITHGHWKPPW